VNRSRREFGLVVQHAGPHVRCIPCMAKANPCAPKSPYSAPCLNRCVPASSHAADPALVMQSSRGPVRPMHRSMWSPCISPSKVLIDRPRIHIEILAVRGLHRPCGPPQSPLQGLHRARGPAR
jgi:hypothetical protein